MTRKEKWEKHTELSAKAEKLHAEWRDVCREIDALIMTRASDEPKRRQKSYARAVANGEV